MEPPMKVTLVSGPVAWKHTPRRGTRKHIQMRITCTQTHVSTVHACKYCTHISHVTQTQRFNCAVMMNCPNYMKLGVKKKNQLITQMHAAGVAAWRWFRGQTAFSNLTLNNADFLLCGQHMKQIFYLYFSRKRWTFSFICRSSTHMWESCRAPSRCGFEALLKSVYFFPPQSCCCLGLTELPMMLTCMTVSAYMNTLALLSVNRCPWARHVQLSQWSWLVKSNRRQTGEAVMNEQNEWEAEHMCTHSANLPLH